MFWDSQPLTGVPADRHLTESQAILGGSAARHRAQFVQSSPAFFVDGLGLLNPALDPRVFPEVRQWLRQYERRRTYNSVRDLSQNDRPIGVIYLF